MFEKIQNWRLLCGSHEFPGPDGGTCISEAAIVAAGFGYRAVHGRGDCPPCFSPVIASYVIRLNDAMSDDLRQQLLMPFIARLAGTADTREREIERARYIATQTVKRILPTSLRAEGPETHPLQSEPTDELNAAPIIAARFAVWAAQAAKNAADAADAAYVVADAVAGYAAAFEPAAARRAIFPIATAILDEAIKLGNQAQPIDMALVVSRMEAIKAKACESA